MSANLTIEEVAKKAGVKQGTLSRRIWEWNRAHADDQVKPDRVDDRGHFKKFYYSETTAKTMAEIATRPRRNAKAKP